MQATARAKGRTNQASHRAASDADDISPTGQIMCPGVLSPRRMVRPANATTFHV